MKKAFLVKISVLVLGLVCIVPEIRSQNTNPMVADTTPAVKDTTPVAAPPPVATPAQDTVVSEPKKEKEGFNSRTRLGLRFGGVISNQDFESSTYTEDPESKLGADLGIVVSIPIGGGFLMFQPELHWMQKGYKASDVPNRGDVNMSLNYIEVPLLARINFGGSLRLFTFFGPSFGFLLDGTYEDDTQSLDATDYLNSTETSGHIGLGVGIGTFELDVRYMAGLSDISDSENLSEVKNSSVGAGITLKF